MSTPAHHITSDPVPPSNGGLVRRTKTERAITGLLTGASSLSLANLHGVIETARSEGADLHAYALPIGTIFEKASDDTLGDLAVDVRIRMEQLTLGLRWIQSRADAEIFNRLVTRRGEDATGKIALPHERADIELVPEFEPYEFDVDALETVAPMLKEDDRAKLLRIEEAHEEPVLPLSTKQREAIVTAISLIEDHVPVIKYHIEILAALTSLLETRKIERRVSAGNSVSIIKLAERYKGSNVETLIRAATTRNKKRDVLKIVPRTSTIAKPVTEAAV